METTMVWQCIACLTIHAETSKLRPLSCVECGNQSWRELRMVRLTRQEMDENRAGKYYDGTGTPVLHHPQCVGHGKVR